MSKENVISTEAQEANVTAETVKNTGAEKQPENENRTVEFTKEQQATIDAQISKLYSKWEAEHLEKIEEAKKEAETVAKMSEKERKDREIQKRLDAVAKREKAINDRELLADIKETLTEEQLPVVFGETLLLLQDRDKIKETIETIKAVWDAEMQQKIKEQFRQPDPKAGSSAGTVDVGTAFAQSRNTANEELKGPNPWA